MKAVVMECRIRVCASRARRDAFVEAAIEQAAEAFPHPTMRSCVVEEKASRMLARQWTQANSSREEPCPSTYDICLAFADSSGRLTAARLESLSRDLLTALDSSTHQSMSAEETIPWILTLVSSTDRRGRRDIALRHPALGLSTLAPMVVG